ncbi:hypothetical protein FLJU110815_20560 [Flavobacterium jumunjinense]
MLFAAIPISKLFNLKFKPGFTLIKEVALNSLNNGSVVSVMALFLSKLLLEKYTLTPNVRFFSSSIGTFNE